MKQLFLTILISLSCLSFSHATVYLSPSKQSLVDVTKLTLDVDSIELLSLQLTNVAKRSHEPMNAKDVRNNARLLYLAMLLNPKNTGAINLNRAYRDNEEVEFFGKDRLNSSYNQVKKYLNFFEREGANESERMLGLMIKDSVEDAFKGARFLQGHEADDKRWGRVVAALSEFEKPGTRPKRDLPADVPADEPAEGKIVDNGLDSQMPPKLGKDNVASPNSPDIVFSVPFFLKDKELKNSKGKAPVQSKDIEWENDRGLNFVKIKKSSSMRYADAGDFERDQPMTVVAWVKPTANAFGSIVSRMDSKTKSNGWDLWLHGGKLTFEMNHQVHKNWIKVESNEKLPLNQWSMVAVSYNGSSKVSGLRLFVNGRVVQSRALGNSLTGSVRCEAQLTIGQRYRGELSLDNCGIALVRLYNKQMGKFQLGRLYRRHSGQGPRRQAIDVQPRPVERKRDITMELSYFNNERKLKDQNNRAPVKRDGTKYGKHEGVYSLKVGNKAFAVYSKEHVPIERTDAFTTSVWLYSMGSGNGAVIAKMDKNKQYRGWDIWLQNNNVSFELIHAWPSNVLKVVAQEQLPKNRWSNVVVSYDGSSKASGVKIYIDGKLCKMKTEHESLTNTVKNDVPFTVGGRYHGVGTVSKMLISYVRVSREVEEAESIKKTADKYLGELNR